MAIRGPCIYNHEPRVLLRSTMHNETALPVPDAWNMRHCREYHRDYSDHNSLHTRKHEAMNKQHYPHIFFHGDKTHGQELIKTLMKKGGTNPDECLGNDPDVLYYLSPKHGYIIAISKYDAMADVITTSFREITPAEIRETPTPICPHCEERLALVKGTFNFTADDEPFESGKEEEVELSFESEELTALICPKCGYLTDFCTL